MTMTGPSMPQPGARGTMQQGPMPVPPGTPKAPTQRKTRIYLIIAVALAVLAGLLVLVGGSGGSETYVFRATDAVAARAKLDAGMFEIAKVGDADVVDGAYSAGSETELRDKVDFSAGLYARYPMSKGTQLTSGLSGDSVELTAPLGADERLVSINAKAAWSVGGTLQVGDFVDVYATIMGNDGAGLSNMIMANAEIVALTLSGDQLDSASQSQQSDNSSTDGSSAKGRSNYLPGDPIPGNYTLRVKASDGERFAVLSEAGQFYIALRGAEADTVIGQATTAYEALCKGPTIGGSSTPAVTAPRAASSACRTTGL